VGTTWSEAISLGLSWTVTSAPDTTKSEVLFLPCHPISG
jgi:hypothetical protein